ncbi:MAG TPA: protein kinase, partial [Micromonosporaceae bacterium]
MPWQVPGYRHRLDLDGDHGRIALAQQESSGDLVVLKRLDADAISDVRDAFDELSALSPDYFVQIREIVEHDGNAAFVMDAINGPTLRALIRDHGALGAEAALLVYRDVLAGLAYAHPLHIVHGEVSPDNVLVDTDGRPVMTNAGAVRWRPREITLTTAVYLAPERWREPPSAPADIYAATVVVFETLTGEPPFWDEASVADLRRRHEQDDIPLDGIPPALRDVVRVGLAKSAESRLEAAPLLELVETVAIAEYGRDWKDRGRELVMQRVELVALPFGAAAVAVADEMARVRDTEDAANDDYYLDEPQPEDERARAADAVVAEAAEIVELARMRDAAESDAMVAASVDEELTEEEEAAVAEIERLLALDEVGTGVETVATETPAETPAEGPEVEEAAAAIVAAEEVGAAEGAVDDDLAAEEEVPVAIGVAALPAAVPTHAPDKAFYRRHPWWTGAAACAVALAIIGFVVWVTAGPSHRPSRPVAEVSTQPAPVVPAPSAAGTG